MHLSIPVKKLENPEHGFGEVSSVHSKILAAHLKGEPPPRLYHYTSAAGLVGMLRDQQIWATNIQHLNDWSEILYTAQTAKQVIKDRFTSRAEGEDERELLTRMTASATSAARRYYVFSLSEAPNLLSQWRAYCPPNGGYSIGFPSRHLANVASAQMFMLCKCYYGGAEEIVGEIIGAFLQRYRELRAKGVDLVAVREQMSWEFGQNLSRVGAVIKHPSFQEEREWRLLSGPIDDAHPQINYRPGRLGLTPYFQFNLVNAEYPHVLSPNGGATFAVLVGPTVDVSASMSALQGFITKYRPGATWISSDVPYRSL